MSLKEKLLKFICPFANEVWWPFWSNVRWRKFKDCDIDIREEDHVHNLKEIKALVKRLYSKFTWTADDASQLWDSICPPPYNYKRYLEGELKDDCDGFHSLVMHCLRHSGIECYLLSAVAVGGGHCILIFKLNGNWYINDYDRVYDAFERAEDAIFDYNETFVKIYKTKSYVVYNGIVDYNCQTGKFKSLKIKDLK